MNILKNLNSNGCDQNCKDCPYFNYMISKININQEPFLSDRWIKNLFINVFFKIKYKNTCNIDEYKI